jgi:hypothetical protein
MSDWDDTERASTATPEIAPAAVAPSGLDPAVLLLAALAAAAIGIVALLGGFPLNLLGYAASSFGVFTLVALFRRRSLERSALLGISPPRNLNLAALGLIAVGFLVSVAQAWQIANHLS